MLLALARAFRTGGIPAGSFDFLTHRPTHFLSSKTIPNAFLRPVPLLY
jgi:hypothetical protein